MYNNLGICDWKLDMDLSAIADRSQKAPYTTLDKICIPVDNFSLYYKAADKLIPRDRRMIYAGLTTSLMRNLYNIGEPILQDHHLGPRFSSTVSDPEAIL